MTQPSQEVGARARKSSEVFCKALHGRGFIQSMDSWRFMLVRCYDTANPAYPRYGGRGIFVSDEWMDFRNFFRDMGERPQGLTLDRINNDDGYHSKNCRWLSKKEQSRNTRRNVWIEKDGKKILLTDAAAAAGLSISTLSRRISAGLSVDDIVSSAKRKTAKLDIGQAEEIKGLILEGFGDVQIAERFDITRQAVSNIRKGKTWSTQ